MNKEDYKIAYENVMIANKMLEQENKQLKEALDIKFYCQYANKCNELYDCTREEYETMAQNNMKLSLENQELKDKREKAIEYIKQYGNLYCLKHIQFKKYKQYEELLEILGDKENE